MSRVLSLRGQGARVVNIDDVAWRDVGALVVMTFGLMITSLLTLKGARSTTGDR